MRACAAGTRCCTRGVEFRRPRLCSRAAETAARLTASRRPCRPPSWPSATPTSRSRAQTSG
eukprot:3740809-Prymnesium_polylepis.1